MKSTAGDLCPTACSATLQQRLSQHVQRHHHGPSQLCPAAHPEERIDRFINRSCSTASTARPGGRTLHSLSDSHSKALATDQLRVQYCIFNISRSVYTIDSMYLQRREDERIKHRVRRPASCVLNASKSSSSSQQSAFSRTHPGAVQTRNRLHDRVRPSFRCLIGSRSAYTRVFRARVPATYPARLLLSRSLSGRLPLHILES